MTKQPMTLSHNDTIYLITPSLLNSWAFIDQCTQYVRESENDTMSYEDKCEIAREKAFNDFLKVLNREPTPTNQYMQMGNEFEAETYKGNTCFSEIVKGGAFQIVGKKYETISGLNFLLYGRLDVLKGGTIFDIKRVQCWKLNRYKTSFQHPFYLHLFSECNDFKYLIFDGVKGRIERYTRDECEDIKVVIADFINWLSINNLLDVYKEKWRSKYGR